jgi:chromosome segregation ATPase
MTRHPGIGERIMHDLARVAGEVKTGNLRDLRRAEADLRKDIDDFGKHLADKRDHHRDVHHHGDGHADASQRKGHGRPDHASRAAAGHSPARTRQSSLNELKAKLNAMNDELDGLKSKLAHAPTIGARQDISGKIRAKTAEIKELSEKIKSLEAKKADMSRHGRRSEGLHKQRSASKPVAPLRADSLAAKREKLRELKDQLEQRNGELQRLEHFPIRLTIS